MTDERAWRRVLNLLAFAFGVIAAATVAFLVVVVDDKAQAIADRSLLSALFFSIQTITTTGYGAGFAPTDKVKAVGCIFMIVGSVTWSVLTAQIASLFVIEAVRGKDRRPRAPRE